MALDFVPIRVCCGQRHAGAVCPDGRVMCCICFERFPLDLLAEDEEGGLTNVCKGCENRGLL